MRARKAGHIIHFIRVLAQLSSSEFGRFSADSCSWDEALPSTVMKKKAVLRDLPMGVVAHGTASLHPLEVLVVVDA